MLVGVDSDELLDVLALVCVLELLLTDCELVLVDVLLEVLTLSEDEEVVTLV